MINLVANGDVVQIQRGVECVQITTEQLYVCATEHGQLKADVVALTRQLAMRDEYIENHSGPVKALIRQLEQLTHATDNGAYAHAALLLRDKLLQP